MLNILKLPSSHSFCEYKYIHSNYIAEYYNTITGLTLCLSSFLFYRNNKHLTGRLNSYLFQANYTLLIVGIGTIFFHGTLLYVFQLFDEIPMFLMTFDYIYILLTITKSNYLYIYYTKYILCFIIIISYFVHPTFQIITFFTLFTTNVCIIILLLYKIPYKNNNITILYYVGCMILLIWLSDSLFCRYIQHFYLHSIWHIVTSILIYLFNNLLKEYIKLLEKVYTKEYIFNKVV